MTTFLKSFKTFKGDFKVVRVREFGGIVEDFDAEEGDDRHDESVMNYVLSWVLENATYIYLM